MSPEEAVERLLAALDDPANHDIDRLYEVLLSAGATPDESDRAFKFTQIACGRMFLQQLGVTFPPEYFCLNAHGMVIEQGLLAAEPHFSYLLRKTNGLLDTPGGQYLALTSSDLHAVNSALHAGSKPEDLRGAPPMLFMEPATPEGIQRAQQMLREILTTPAARNSANTSATKTARPWWKFWA